MKAQKWLIMVFVVLILTLTLTMVMGSPTAYVLENGGEVFIKAGESSYFSTRGTLEVEAASENFFIFRDDDGYRVFVPEPAEPPLDRPNKTYFVMSAERIPEGTWEFTEGYVNLHFSGDGEIIVQPTLSTVFELFCTILVVFGFIALLVEKIVLKRRDG